MNWEQNFSIGDKEIGVDKPCFFIAEIGSNHDCSLPRALELMEAAAKSGADAVKFQLFSGDGLVARRIRDSEGHMAPNPVHPIIERLALPLEWLGPLSEGAKDLGVELMATPFDLQRLEKLIDSGARAIKIASGDLTYLPLIRAAAASGAAIFLSCGMSDEEETATALRVAYEAGARRVVLLHCVSRYPPDDAELNLRAMAAMGRRFGIPVGLSDHSAGVAASLGAVALGACAIEKHFTLDRSLPGPDHPFAEEPKDFSAIVASARRLQSMLGRQEKRPTEKELAEQEVGRRSLVAARDLKCSEILSAADIKIVRPGGGMSPSYAEKIVGRKLSRNIEEDEFFSEQDFSSK